MILENNLKEIIGSQKFIEKLKEKFNSIGGKYKYLVELSLAIYEFCENNDIDYIEVTEKQAKELGFKKVDNVNAASFDKDEYGKYLLYVITRQNTSIVQYCIQAAFHELIHILCNFKTSKFYKNGIDLESMNNEREKQAQFGSYVLCKLYKLDDYDDFSFMYLDKQGFQEQEIDRIQNELHEVVHYIFTSINETMEKQRS